MESRLQPVFTREQTSQPGVAVAESQNRVLRNTYWLLALSMLPTIAGAWVGMQMNFVGLFRSAPILAPLAMFGVMLAALFGVTALRNSAWGVPALFGFTFIAGVMLAPILSVAAGFRNGGQLVASAAFPVITHGVCVKSVHNSYPRIASSQCETDDSSNVQHPVPAGRT